jgi:hypothetical protein
MFRDQLSSYKKWIVTGVVIFLGSAVAAIVVTHLGIYFTFDNLEKNLMQSIAASKFALEMVLLVDIVFGITGLIGLVFLAIGCVKAYRHSKSSE